MTYEEAMTHAIEGMRVRCTTMQSGCYVEHSFSRGYLRCWPVDRVEDEPSRTQCDYHPAEIERASLWAELERPKVDSWGKAIDVSFFTALAEQRDSAEHTEVKPQRSKWGQQSSEAAVIAARQRVGEGWGKPAPQRDAWGRAVA